MAKRERWGLTWRGRLLALALGVGGAVAIFLGVHPFLAVNDKAEGGLLVVEGWVPAYALDAAANEFKRGSYRRLITTGGPSKNTGSVLAEYDSYAQLGAEALAKLGLKAEQVASVHPATPVRDRTYTAGLTLKAWLAKNDPNVKSVTVVTLDVHARRSRLLYRQALGKGITVGIIAIANREYDPKHWWRYSEGVKEIMSEAAAYLYARFFFYPPRT